MDLPRAAFRQVAVEVVPLDDAARVLVLKQWSWHVSTLHGPRAPVSEKQALRRLIEHPGFIDDYITVDSHLGPNTEDGSPVEWHGPFIRGDIRPECFVPVSSSEARAVFEGFVGGRDFPPLTPASAKRLECVRHRVAFEDSSAYVLRMPEGARSHGLSHLFSRPGAFGELVLVDSKRELVTTLAMVVD